MPQTSIWFALTHGTTGLLLSYLLVAVPYFIGLGRSRAPPSAFAWAPVWSIALLLAAAALMTLLTPWLLRLGVAMNGFTHDLISVLVAVGVGYSGGRVLGKVKRNADLHRRGAVVSDADAHRRAKQPLTHADRQNRTSDSNAPLLLAGFPVAVQDETKHFKFIGTTGTGKSTAIREILCTALARGDRVVIADPDGGYLKHFYDSDRGDVILNPFEPDAVKWNLVGEIANAYDVEQLARSLIPDGADRTWPEYARTFFTAVTQKSIANGVKEDAEIYRLLTQAPLRELRVLLADTAAAPFLEEGNERMFGSLRSVTSSAVAALRYTTAQNAAPFSVRQWVRHGAARRNGGQGGVLFMPYKAGEIAALRSTISAWLRIAIFEAMDRPEGDQYLWFIVDELDALGEIDGLKDALARLRKFGGRCVLGFQSISQVSGTYGKAAADTIVENCGNTLILRCSASEMGGTSQFASRLIGQREIVYTTKSKSRQPNEWLATTTTSEHRSVEYAVMASEIERLADLEGYLKIASISDWVRTKLVHVNYSEVARSRVPKVAADPTPLGKKSRRQAASTG